MIDASTDSSPDENRVVPVFELHFSPRALVRSRLESISGEVFETGSKGCEVRWQQGAIAVCILAVFTRLRGLLGDAAAPLIEGGRGSPARSIDNLLTKPGDWALNMFGEDKGMPKIRDFVYRKKAVSKSNPVSAVQWDVEQLPIEAIRIWREGLELTTADELRALLKVLLEEFNPRRAEREWNALFPQRVGSSEEETEREEPAGSESGGASPLSSGVPSALASFRGTEPSTRPWMLLLVLFVFVGVGAYLLGRAMGTLARPERPTANSPASSSAKVVESFIELLNAGALTQAYALTSASFQEEISPAAFALALGHQRFNFPRVAGNPYRNGVDQLIHEYRVTLYVETEVRRIPALEGLARMPVTQIEAYAIGIQRLIAELQEAGVDPIFLRQLRKDRLERSDASRYLQLTCGLNDDVLDQLYPEAVSVTLDLTYFFELVRDSADENAWRIQTVADASDRLVTF